MSAAAPIKVEIWSDIACPWCYLGKRRFEAAVAQFAQEAGAPAVQASYRSFQLSPDLPADFSGSHVEYLGSKLGWSPEQVAQADQRLQSLGAPYGIAYNYDINRVVNTHKAHQLLHYAKAHGAQAQVKDLLLKAFFSDGVDLSQLESLADVAQAAGLDRADALRALQQQEYADAVEQDKAQAARYGISGVPFFVIDGRYGLSGAQEPETFLQALRQAAAQEDA